MMTARNDELGDTHYHRRKELHTSSSVGNEGGGTYLANVGNNPSNSRLPCAPSVSSPPPSDTCDVTSPSNAYAAAAAPPTTTTTDHKNQSPHPPSRTETRRMPCRARGVQSTHTDLTAYFDIPSDAPHGMLLVCSDEACTASGRKFLYCRFCDAPVAKRNFHRRHGHAGHTLSRSSSSSSKKKKEENTAKQKRTVKNDDDDEKGGGSPTKKRKAEIADPPQTQQQQQEKDGFASDIFENEEGSMDHMSDVLEEEGDGVSRSSASSSARSSRTDRDFSPSSLLDTSGLLVDTREVRTFVGAAPTANDAIRGVDRSTTQVLYHVGNEKTSNKIYHSDKFIEEQQPANGLHETNVEQRSHYQQQQQQSEVSLEGKDNCSFDNITTMDHHQHIQNGRHQNYPTSNNNQNPSLLEVPHTVTDETKTGGGVLRRLNPQQLEWLELLNTRPQNPETSRMHLWMEQVLETSDEPLMVMEEDDEENVTRTFSNESHYLERQPISMQHPNHTPQQQPTHINNTRNSTTPIGQVSPNVGNRYSASSRGSVVHHKNEIQQPHHSLKQMYNPGGIGIGQRDDPSYWGNIKHL